MENAYGIGITNRYAMFIDDEERDPLDILKEAEIADKNKVKKVEVAKPAAKVAPKAVGKKEPVRKDDNSDKENQRNNPRFEGKRVMDARRAQDGPREERNNRINQEGGPRRDMDDENRGRGRGAGGPRGGRGMGRGRGDGAPRGRDGPGRGGKREYERKSGDSRTGIKAEDKRGGGGKGNWGTIEDDMKAKDSEEGTMNTSVEEGAAPKEDDEEKREEGDEEVPREEEVKELTLDEWKALQSKTEQPKFNLRKAGEGSDIDPKWKKAAAYKKEKEGQDDEEEEEENYVYPQRANRQKHLLDINFQFADQQAMRGGGRGRGRGRGGDRGDRGGDRGDRGGDRGDRGGDRGDRGGDRGDRGVERADRGERADRPERAERGERSERGGERGRGRGGNRGGPPREGEGAPRRGGRGGRGGSQQFSLDDQKAFPALG